MSLIYKFKKEKLDDGNYTYRPRILVALSGDNASIEIPALLDSGADITVIPEKIANAVGLEIKGKKSKLYGHRESCDVTECSAAITFLGKANRESIRINIPVLITHPKKDFDEEDDMVLGVRGIFDIFDITFKKTQNKIIMKKASKVGKLGFLN